jgi:Phosphotransferase enzyme family
METFVAPNVVQLRLETVADYLVNARVMDPADLVIDDVAILERSRRNRNFCVLRNDGRGLFVKQLRNAHSKLALELRREAICSFRLSRTPALAELRPLVAPFRHYDPQNHILVTGYCDTHRPVPMARTQEGYPDGFGTALGAALARVHAPGVVEPLGALTHGLSSATSPWILSIARTGLPYEPSQPAAPELLAWLKQSPLAARLDKLAQTWRACRLLHGDIKWDNLLTREPADGAGVELKLVDWELSGLGDPAWDVACALASFELSRFVTALATGSSYEPDPLGASATEEDRRQRRELWRAYERTADFGEEAPAAFLNRALALEAARLLQGCFEYLHSAPDFPPAVFALARLAESLGAAARGRELSEDAS